MNQNYNNTIEQLYGKLPDYLESMGIAIDGKGFFSCIHPDHPDKNPSCSLNYGNVLENKVFHCFSKIGHDGNIFTAAHWLENLPLQGADFWNVTVKTLCERYDIEFSALEVDEDTRRRFQAQRAQTDSARIIKSMSYDGLDLKTSHIGIKHLLDRGITEKSIRDFNIGVLSSFKEYVDAMFKLGHTDEEFLYSKGLMNKSIFNRDSFIIPIQNLKNQTVGFVSRNCRHDPNEHVNQKYVNSPNSDIYKKGEILFSYNSAIKQPGTLYIVEGYLDCMMMKQAGLEKVVALGSTVLTEKHVDILFDNETDICLCLDADKGGEDGTKLAIERLGVYSKFTIKIIDLPKDYDPDKFINEFGLDEFLKLEKLSPFMWSLKHSTYADDLTIVAQKMIPIIAADQSSISRLRMIKDLSNFTGISETDIKSDVDALVNKEDSKYVQELQDINQFVQMQLSRSRVSDTKAIIREAHNKIDILSDKYHNNKDLRLEYFHELEALQNKIITGEYKYGLAAPNFKMLEKTLDGIPYWANLMLLAGRPSSGKCLGYNTPILMYDGSIKPVQEIKNGDVVMGVNSQPRVVQGATRGREMMYWVRQRSGMDYRVNESHIISLKRSRNGRGLNPKVKHGDIENIEISEYLKKSNKYKNNMKGWKTKVDFPKADTFIDPYYFGLWLGDGCTSRPNNISGNINELEIRQYLNDFANQYGLKLVTYKDARCNNTINYSLSKTSGNKNIIWELFKENNVTNKNNILKQFKINSYENRLKLLAGIIDSDGYYNGRYVEIVMNNESLIDDIKYVCDTLGFKCTKLFKNTTAQNGYKGTAWRLNINGNLDIIPTKVKKLKSAVRDWTMNSVVVEQDRIDDYYGFTVDGDHLFLLGDCTVTHNTCTATALSMDIIEANPDAAIFYMSIDDTMTLLSTKMLAVRSGLSTTEIRSYNSLTEDKQALVDEAMGFLKGVSDRYIIADTTKGNSVDALENHVKWFCKEFKNHKKLFFLDNFHKLQLEAKGMNQKKDVISDASSRIKDIADINDINIIATVELRKLLRETDRPTRQDMQGSNKLDYDATVVGLVHNDLQVNETSEIRHIMEVEGEAKEMPYIEVNIAKNKINGKIGTIPLKFNTHNMRVTEGNHSEWIRLKNKSKKRSQQF